MESWVSVSDSVHHKVAQHQVTDQVGDMGNNEISETLHNATVLFVLTGFGQLKVSRNRGPKTLYLVKRHVPPVGDLQGSFLAMLALLGVWDGEERVPSKAQDAKRPNNTVPVIFEFVDNVRVARVHEFIREQSTLA